MIGFENTMTFGLVISTDIALSPGKPVDYPFIESCGGSSRDECLNVNWFLSLENVEVIESGR